MQPAIQQKQTPTHRRPGGRNRNNPHQKTYASENDVPRYKPDSFVNPSTPQKSVSGDQSQRANSTGQKQRNRNNNSSKKPRHKNGALSPGLNKLNQQLQSKEASAPIFAGSTFHASPAPSALPIPSFLSKSESPAPKATSSPDQGLSSPSTESDEASPPSPTCVPRTDESPLEFFFRADRAEKAQTRRASSANSTKGDAIPIGPFSPPRGSPMERNTPPKSAESRTARRPQYQKRSTVTGIPPNELDGNPGQPVGPAFSTPFQERIRAVRPNQNSAHGTPTMVRNQDLNSRLDSPDALKRYLFTGRLGSDDEQPTPSRQSSQEQTQSAHQRARQQHRMPRGMFPASVLTANAQSSPSTVPPAHAQLTPYRSEQLLAMEDGLKRMLKLDSSSQSLPLR
ncbi:hypothetical protein F4821DRAFT_172908 [Hypoxylon rubiginosum]|uniref:Uncharacterized protein n=1 Tax=Hypoxylon rubiginosum TaxID=110542 RepID=A0ACC0DGR2_9PEZI|nr:hypothetical protein F4821DRAFT_172908 [Hypoxylon rubiginosum]